MKGILKRISFLALSAVMTIGTSFSNVGSLTSVFAESQEFENFDKTNIKDDIDDLLTPIEQAAQKQKNNLEVIAAMEYCYSENESIVSDYYGFYVYIYNPPSEPNGTKRSPIQTSGNSTNTVNMAVEYTDSGEPEIYRKVELSYCSSTSDHVYYKFKVADSEALYERVKLYDEDFGGAEDYRGRRYDVAGVEVMYEQGSESDVIRNANDIQHEKTYYYKGYAIGCDETSKEKSTLTCTYDDLETIALDLMGTYWRGVQNEDTHISDQVNTVYFSVPDKYFDYYGGLQKIRAEWWEYKPNPIFVTSDQGAYDALKEYIGVDIGETNNDLDWRVLWEEKKVGTASIYEKFLRGYNNRRGKNDLIESAFSDDAEFEHKIDWLFFKGAVQSDEDYTVKKKELESYADTYTYESMCGEEDKIQTAQGGSYSKNLFSETIDEDRSELLNGEAYGRKGNYIQQEIDAGETVNLMVEENQSWWDKLWKGTKYTEKNIDPIVVLNDSIKNMEVEEFAEKYMIDADDAENILEDCKKQLSLGKKPVLFRFAVTDYYSSKARFDKIADFGEEGHIISEVDGYVAEETMFFNFDIISLTFRSLNNVDTVIPVVADPINLIASVVGPEPTGTELSWEWLKKLWNDIITFFNSPFGKAIGTVLFVLFVAVVIVVAVQEIKSKPKKKTSGTKKKKSTKKKAGKSKSGGNTYYFFSTISGGKKKK